MGGVGSFVVGLSFAAAHVGDVLVCWDVSGGGLLRRVGVPYMFGRLATEECGVGEVLRARARQTSRSSSDCPYAPRYEADVGWSLSF